MEERANKKSFRPWAILIACCIMCAVGFGGGSTCVSLFVAPLMAALDASATSISLFFMLMCIAGIPGAIIAPRLLKVNAGVFAGLGGVCAGGAFMFMAAMPSLPTLYVSALIVGFCSSFTTTLMAPIMINNWFGKNQGTLVGVALAFTGIGGAILSPIVTSVIEASGWQSAMMLLGILIAVVVGGLGFACIRFSPAKYGLEPYGAEDASDSGEADHANVDGKEAPGLPLKAFFKSAAVIPLLLSIFFAGLVACVNQQTNAISQLSGFTAVTAGLVVSVQSIGNIFGKLMLGAIRDKLGGSKAGAIGAMVAVAGLLLMLFGIFSQQEIMMLLGGFVCGLGSCLGTMGAPLFTMDAAGPKDYANILGIVSVFSAVGVAIGSLVVSVLYDMTGTYVMSLVVLAVFAILIIPCAMIGIHGLQKKWQSE